MADELKFKLFEKNVNSQIITNDSKKDINPFETYNVLYEELNGQTKGALNQENFEKLLNGEIESDDVLALSIIDAFKSDETNSFFDFLQFDEVKNDPQRALELYIAFYGQKLGKQNFAHAIKAPFFQD